MGRLSFLTGQTTSTSRANQAVDAATAWLNAELPKIRSWVTSWLQRVPASPTRAEAVALNTELYARWKATGAAWQATVKTPFLDVWQPGGYADPTMAPILDASVEEYRQAYAPAFTLNSERLKPLIEAPVTDPYAQAKADCAAKSGWLWSDARTPSKPTEPEGCLSPETVALRSQDAAWKSWLNQSLPLFVELDRVAQEAPTADADGLVALENRAAQATSELHNLAQQVLGAYGGPAWVGAISQKTLAQALEMIAVRSEQATKVVASQRRVRGLAEAAAQEYGYVTDEYGNLIDPRRVTPPPAGGGFNIKSLVIPGLALLALLVARKVMKR